MQSSISTLDMLKGMYPGAVLLDAYQVAAAIGLSVKTIRNSGDKFPVPSVKLGDNRRYRLVDVAAVIDGGFDGSAGGTANQQKQEALQAPRRGRGRPRKVAGREV